ncbi:YczE/YyaS/YitT family protein [Terrilactibacillus laevilacticus]|uniref:YitT family protein n=1 Tax=Terrilactibacillus laevilacticus TaxID=1380157 RepID=A0ABW5PTD4_9BACI|nr:YitT family protein [Terrilactibacillus laevilacticus]
MEARFIARHRFLYEQLVYWIVFFVGIVIMNFGIALMITASLGSAPWDVFHIGLFQNLGLTIGTWSIIVGLFILGLTAILKKERPQIGAFANMFIGGVMLDFFLSLPFMKTPSLLSEQIAMLIVALAFNGIGISIYISAKRGAGPRDTLMLYLTEVTGLKLSTTRRLMELFVLIIGWFLGGPVSIGTILFGLFIGSVVGKILPICENIVKHILGRGAHIENIHKRPIRADHYDGFR